MPRFAPHRVPPLFLVALMLAMPLAGADAQTSPPAASPDITVNGQNAPTVITPIAGGKDFISPMGEPFHSTDNLSAAEHWFRQADADGNGRITLAEFKADEVRWFAALDTDKDGDIGPQEIDHYEEYLAPEVKVTSTWGDMDKSSQDSDGNFIPPPYPERMGAGRISWLAIPEPVTYADTNFDRGVSRREFEIAAEQRFKALDANHNGVLTRDELPKLTGQDHKIKKEDR